MSEPAWLSQGRDHLWRPYCQMKTANPALPVVATRGSRLVLADGRELVDGLASWWTACHGYNHPHIAAAVREQLERMPHVMFGGLSHEPANRLATRLAALLPGDLNHVFLAESGSVSVEIAMKMALQFHINRGVKGRTRFLAFRGGYHGDTLATMTVCDPDEGMHSLFDGVMPRQQVGQMVHVVVAEGQGAGRRQLRSGPQTGVRQFIDQDQVVGPGQGRDDAGVGEIA